ncbi:MAG: ribonuclease HII [Maricaulaceae bacterium]|jgi:ribonuclease HII
MPDWSIEIEEGGTVAGVDEAGRGPAAGPVVAAAVVLHPDLRSAPPAELARLDDSKKLTAAARERLFAALQALAAEGRARIGVGLSEPEEIDRANILGATMIAMARAVADLGAPPETALVDGNAAPKLACRVRTVIGGDGVSLSIAAASIIAKVARDRLMTLAHHRWPVYGFDRHAGYPTQAHRTALLTYGPCPIHRRSWAPVREAMHDKALAAVT